MTLSQTVIKKEIEWVVILKRDRTLSFQKATRRIKRARILIPPIREENRPWARNDKQKGDI